MRAECLLLSLALILPIRAATIEGTVFDPSGAAVAGAQVVVSTQEGAPHTITADAQGHFRLSDIPDGIYTVRIDHPGFAAFGQQLETGGPPLTIRLVVARQETTVEVAGNRSSAANSDPVYAALRKAEPVGAYRVKDFSLQRDAGVFTFTSGVFSLLPPVEGRITGAVFMGEGVFRLSPAPMIERRHLALITGHDTVEEPFRSLVLWFSDKTGEEIKAHAESVDESTHAKDEWRTFHNHLRHRTEAPRSFLEAILASEDVANLEAEATAAIYDPGQAGWFKAFIHGNKHANLRFVFDPNGAMPALPSPEEVALLNLDPDSEEEGIWYLTHSLLEWKASRISSEENHRAVQAVNYRIETAIGKNDHLSGVCAVRFKSLRAGTRVVHFSLLANLRVARVTQNGREVSFIQEPRKEDSAFYVVLPAALKLDEVQEVVIEYEGDKVIRKEGAGNYSVDARTSWYPNLNSFTDHATYDLTFKVPRRNTVVSVGKPVRQWQEDQYDASQWVSEVPLAVAGFNYGLYKKKSVEDAEAKYTIETYATAEAPDYLRNSFPNLSPSHMAESALVDVQNSIRLFQFWFGPAPYGRIAVTQQPQFNFGQSWPTLVYLPVSAFLDPTERYMLLGQNTFRFSNFIEEVTPHEVSHQWWGHMVGWASYHDQWLSEGFAHFSAGLFIEQIEKKQDEFVKFWERSREHVVDKGKFGARESDAGPIWLGLRLDTFKTESAYRLLVYEKGGFVLHMLRSLMWDPQKGNQDFIDLMHDFVSTSLHQNASTESFKAAVERHMKPALNLAGNGRMDWFFDQWVYGTELPSYQLDYSLAPESGGTYLFTGQATQSGVSDSFLMSIPVYFDVDGSPKRVGSVNLRGSVTSKEFKVRLPKKPKRVALNVYNDVLAVSTTAKERK